MAIVDELISILGFEIKGEQDLKRYQRGLDQTTEKAKRFAAELRPVAVAGAAVAAAAGGFLAKSVVDTSAKFEQFEATLKIVEGSAAKAKDSLQFISDFASSTPFEIEQLTAAFVKLRTFGIDPTDGTFRVLGDVAAAMGKTLDQAVEAFADAATGEFERLKEFGVKASTAGKNVTFAWTKNGEELTKTVKKNGEEIREFLLDNFGSRFAGAMQTQAKTFKGITGNISDVWTEFKRNIGEAGFFDAVKGQFQGVLDWLNRLKADGTLQAFAETIGRTFTKVIEVASRVRQRLVQIFSAIGEALIEAFGPNVFRNASFVLGGVAALFAPLVVGVLGFILIVEDLWTAFEGGESVIANFINNFLDANPRLKSAVEGIGSAVGEFFEAIDKLVSAIGKVFEPIAELIQEAFLVPLKIAEEALIGFAGLSPDFSFLDILLAGLEGITSLIEKMAEAINSLASFIPDIASSVSSAIGKVGKFLGFGGDEEQSSKGGVTTVAKTKSPSASFVDRFVQSNQDEGLQKALSNFAANNNATQTSNAAQVIANDNSSDSRDQSVTVQTTVHQTLSSTQQLSQGAARAVGNSTGSAVGQQARIVAEPAAGS